jgi:ferredoxin
VKFEEYSPSLIDYSAIIDHAGKDQLKDSQIYKSCLIISLLPAHPYQYPLHQYIKEYLTQDTLSRIQNKYNIQEITFILNRKMKFFYEHIIKDLNCRFLYMDPQYPLLINGEHYFPEKESQVLDWYDFITMSMTCNGKRITEIPVAVTVFDRNHRKKTIRYYNFREGSSLADIRKTAHISEEGVLLTNHPFNGIKLTPDVIFSEIKPVEILVLPENGIKKMSAIKKLFLKFTRNYIFFKESTNTSDQYKDNPCQKCLHCTSICPVGLFPYMLSAISEKGSLKDAVQLKLKECIECGLCSYACPSDIPLMHNILKLKKEL